MNSAGPMEDHGKVASTFPYHIGINPVLFLFAGFIVVLIAFISVSSQTVKAALMEPAKTLKYE